MFGSGVNAIELLQAGIGIAILAFLIYQAYVALEMSQALQLLMGAMLILPFVLAAVLLRLDFIIWLINNILPGVIFGVAIVFQPELRKIILSFGRTVSFGVRMRRDLYRIDGIINTCDVLASKKRGALIVFTRRVGIKEIADSGTRLNADLSASLLITIFSSDNPLHDGAVVLDKGRVVSAGCFLPLSNRMDLRNSFGTRHRAALGLAEESDAVILVVSEENGSFSLAMESRIHYNLPLGEIRAQLVNAIGEKG